MKLLSRNPDKPKKQLETTIGKIIYGFLLFMPLLAVLIACGYVVFNKNAYQSYSEKTQLPNEMGAHQDYNFTMTDKWVKIKDNGTLENYGSLSFSNSKNFDYKYNDYIYFVAQIQNSTLTTFQVKLYSQQTTTYQSTINLNKITINENTYFYGIGTITYDKEPTNVYLYNNANNLDGTIINFGMSVLNNYYESIPNPLTFFQDTYSSLDSYFHTGFGAATNKSASLDNVFYYQLEKLEESNLFNWTKETGTYEVVHNTTQLLGITNTYIPMLLTYWLMISVMYFVYDIALMLIMVVHRKIHELQESI